MTPDRLPRAPLAAELLTSALDDLSAVHLVGTRCDTCHEGHFGRHALCPNCASSEVATMVLSDRGVLHTFTVVRHRPPGDRSEPFRPFGIGLVELEEGVRVMAPLKAEVADLQIGMPLALAPFVVRIDEEGREIVGFAYRPESWS